MPRAQPQESYTTQARVIANTSPKELPRPATRVKAIPKKNLPATCDVCHKEIARAGDLPRHKKTHLTDKSSILHYCPLCDFSSIQRSNVTVHIRIHTGEKPLQCPDCATGKFADPGSLTRHRKRFHGYVPVPRSGSHGGSGSGSGLSSSSAGSTASRSPSADAVQQYSYQFAPHDQQLQAPQVPLQVKPRFAYEGEYTAMMGMNQNQEKMHYEELSEDSSSEDEEDGRQGGVVTRHQHQHQHQHQQQHQVQHSMTHMDAHLNSHPAQHNLNRNHGHDHSQHPSLRHHQFASISSPVSRHRVSDARSTSRD